MTIVGLIRVLRQVLTEDVERSKLGKACGYIVITAFGVRAIIVYLLTLAPISVMDRFWSL